jgi:hypothetical protein
LLLAPGPRRETLDLQVPDAVREHLDLADPEIGTPIELLLLGDHLRIRMIRIVENGRWKRGGEAQVEVTVVEGVPQILVHAVHDRVRMVELAEPFRFPLLAQRGEGPSDGEA